VNTRHAHTVAPRLSMSRTLWSAQCAKGRLCGPSWPDTYLTTASRLATAPVATGLSETTSANDARGRSRSALLGTTTTPLLKRESQSAETVFHASTNPMSAYDGYWSVQENGEGLDDHQRSDMSEQAAIPLKPWSLFDDDQVFAAEVPITATQTKVEPISAKRAAEVVSLYHYKGALPAVVSFSFGLINQDGGLLGAVTFGPPASPQVARSVYSGSPRLVTELSRLVISGRVVNRKCLASRLVGGALRALPRPRLVVSYSDTAYGHEGVVYQATNFIYCGTTRSHDSLYLIPGEGEVHPRVLAHRGITSPKEWAKEMGFEEVRPSPKHRYVFLCGSRTQKRHLRAGLLWEPVKRKTLAPSGITKSKGDD